MAAINLVTITAVPPSGSTQFASPCEDIQINPANIQQVVASDGPAGNVTYGVRSAINVKYVKANHFESAIIYSTMTPTEVKAATNA